MSAQFFVDGDPAPIPNQPRRLGVILGLLEGSSVLMEHRVDSDLWGFIGGGVEDGESLETALRREVLEECGLEAIDSLRVSAIFSGPGRIASYPDGNASQLVTVAFLARYLHGEVVPSKESVELEFVSISQLRRRTIAPTHRAFAELLYANESDLFTMPTQFD